MLHKIVFLITLFSLIASHTLLAGTVTERIKSSQTLVVGTTGDFPPFAANTTQGKVIGFDIDLAHKLANGLGLTLQLKQMEFSKLLPAIKDGSIDIALSGITMMPSRNLDVAFIGPYATSGQSLLGKEQIISAISSNEALASASFRIAALQGSTSEKAAREGIPHAKVTLTTTHDQSLILLLKGDVDAILADFPFCKVAEFRYPQHKLKALEGALTFEPLGIAISGDDPLLQNLIQNFLLVMEGSGTLEKLKKKWFKSNVWIKELPDMDFFKNLEQ
jgi:polar amino acid transport system substrate-binding protein